MTAVADFFSPDHSSDSGPTSIGRQAGWWVLAVLPLLMLTASLAPHPAAAQVAVETTEDAEDAETEDAQTEDADAEDAEDADAKDADAKDADDELDVIDDTMTPSEAKLAAFDGRVTPAYEFDKPLWVYYETKRQKDLRGSTGWLWGLSPGHFFIERAGRGGKNATPSGKWQVFDYDQLKGVLSDGKNNAGFAFKFDPNIHNWKNIYTSTVGKMAFRDVMEVDAVYENLEKAAEAERKELIPVEEVEAPVAAAPPAPRPVAPAAAPERAPEQAPAPAANEAVDQLKALPDMYKWAIGIGAVLVILFFVRR